jgi:ribosomal protein S18 acetylase RimI-like enzyme
MESEYDVVSGLASAERYVQIREQCGLGPRSLEAAVAGLSGTWFGVVVRHAEEIVGMGRVIGDGGTFFQVVDIAVLPEHRGRGLGERVVAMLVDELRRAAPPSAYVSLIADGEANRLYARHGFNPTAPASIGMSLQL